MNPGLPYPIAGWLILAGLVAAAPAQEYGRSLNDIGGVGAQGEIGRGTSPRERPSAWGPLRDGAAPMYVGTPSPTPPQYVYVYVMPAAPAAAAVAEGTAAATPMAPLREPAMARRSPYVDLNRSWLHGYWNAHASRSPSWRLSSLAREGSAGTAPEGGGLVPIPAPVPGMGLGWGLPAWLIGPVVYRWGYYPYLNPFVPGKPPRGDGRPRAVDYSRPLEVLAAPPTEVLLDEAMRRFAAARRAFRREDYSLALARADETLRLMPYDPTVHQLRAHALRALGRYREAAAALHSVIAIVPGWDWTTMATLYKNPETYTSQLRALEAYSWDHPGEAEAAFLLAVEYLMTGYPDEASERLRAVAELRPDDTLSGPLLRELQPPRADGPAPAAPRPGEAGKLEGTWTARPRADTKIVLSLQVRGLMEWRVARAGEEASYRGFYQYDRGILSFIEDEDNALVGRVAWTDPRHFSFRVLEGRPDEPGLAFEGPP